MWFNITCSIHLFIIYVLLNAGESGCSNVQCNEIQSSRFKNFYYVYDRYISATECSWKFQPKTNLNGNQFALLVNVLYFYQYSSSSYPSNLYLPDGTTLTNMNVDRNSDPLCRLYTPPNTECGQVENYNCTTKKSLVWPPRINVSSSYIRIRLSYSLIDCPVVPNSYPTSTDTGDKNMKANYLISLGFASALGFVSLLLIFALAYKLAANRKSRGTSPTEREESNIYSLPNKPNANPVYDDPNSPSINDEAIPPPRDQPVMVDNVIYGKQNAGT